MRKVVVFNNLTLDGVLQSPGRPEEDQRGGFQHGGWGAPYNAMQSSEAGESLTGFGALLLGRYTYTSLYDFWSKQVGNPFTERLTQLSKYVASTTLSEPLPWENSTLLKGNVLEAVATLKAGAGDDLIVMGSGNLIQTLMKHRLIDRYILLIHPLVLGSGRRLFPDNGVPAQLRLVSTKGTANGVAVTTYVPA